MPPHKTALQTLLRYAQAYIYEIIMDIHLHMEEIHMNGIKKEIVLPPVPEDPKTTSFYGSEEDTKKMQEFFDRNDDDNHKENK